ncbi:MAG: ABC transporter permease [Lachnospiraceae bacterium]|nr:ABC transporter permease [Lachnospiraceae bacterium]MBQ2577786.1 ABC transporter permease [Lachnospiraceae bacterium]MBQ5484978.1 ABC transporter permease [Lachnospiraceae bacterium]MCR4731589.1 ABC transporter permease [Lachnospiraceae bacterium]MEE3355008.1 ABC transporter permease [Candidatus Weimeria sp.]
MRFRRRTLSIPYVLFLLVFVVAPLAVVLIYAFTNGQGRFTLENFFAFFKSSRTIATLLYSMWIAFVTTMVCLLLAYPTAYVLARGGFKKGGALLLLAVLPMWINFTLRITAVKELLDAVEGNLAYYPFLNTIIGQVYDFLPFMILPIYNVLLSLDQKVLEAGRDLGADPKRLFWQVILPMSRPGIVSGITMVFLPAMTNYVVLDMLYNSTYIMGSLIGSYFNAYDWHNGSMISAILLMIIAFFSWLEKKAGGDISDSSAARGGSLL